MSVDRLDARMEYCRTSNDDCDECVRISHYKTEYVHWLEDRYLELKSAAEERGVAALQPTNISVMPCGETPDLKRVCYSCIKLFQCQVSLCIRTVQH